MGLPHVEEAFGVWCTVVWAAVKVEDLADSQKQLLAVGAGNVTPLGDKGFKVQAKDIRAYLHSGTQLLERCRTLHLSGVACVSGFRLVWSYPTARPLVGVNPREQRAEVKSLIGISAMARKAVQGPSTLGVPGKVAGWCSD